MNSYHTTGTFYNRHDVTKGREDTDPQFNKVSHEFHSFEIWLQVH